ncbi:sarcosine oxidase subunit gamma [Kocuria flava]|uniref:sarcosine oxidase subunit gamma n=1 Tax=Kocuria flava TaxID=446860 RepID=UPI003F1B5C5C
MAEQLMTDDATDITTLRRSPLAHLAGAMAERTVTGERGAALREVPFLTMVGLRLVPGTGSASTVTDLTGLPLPGGHGEVTGDPATTAVLWLGPDEFLLVGPDETVVPAGLTGGAEREPGALPSLSTAPAAVRLSEALAGAGVPGQVVDLSANRTTLELSGPSAREVLEKGCPMDLHPRAFAAGTAVATTLGPVQVLLWRTGEQEWRIMPRASFADYTARWLLDAMTEFAAPRVP